MAGLQLLDPFEGFDEAFKSMWRPVRFELAAPAPSIKLEVSESDAEFHVKAQIPGVRKEDIRVKIDGDVVSISAETKQQKEEKKGKVVKSEFQYGSAQRSFSLGTDVDSAKSKARYENGILELTLPKKPDGQATTLAIQ
ncbi:MAG TPA: Hsp20/alpha crystallin family protein [Burkholderiaceae bacterium]|nr:Hsp20/alpha crystallin family protein [Burkholderiaceae bacterium]